MKRIGLAAAVAIVGLALWRRWRTKGLVSEAPQVTPRPVPGWSCGSCSVPGEGPPPTFTSPERCPVCEADVFPNGLYRRQDRDVTKDGILLMDRSFPRVHVHLNAEIPESGDLLLSGQDLGFAAEAMGGGGEYEYYVKVERTHLPELVSSLLRETERDEEVPDVAFHAGQVSIRLTDLNKVTLLLLREGFTDSTFTNTTDFMDWCTAHDIPYSGAAF